MTSSLSVPTDVICSIAVNRTAYNVTHTTLRNHINYVFSLECHTNWNVRIRLPFVTYTKLRQNVRTRTLGHVRPAKIQVSLRIHTDWSGSTLGTFWLAKDAKVLHADNEDSDVTAQKWAYIFEGTFSHVRVSYKKCLRGLLKLSIALQKGNKQGFSLWDATHSSTRVMLLDKDTKQLEFFFLKGTFT